MHSCRIECIVSNQERRRHWHKDSIEIFSVNWIQLPVISFVLFQHLIASDLARSRTGHKQDFVCISYELPRPWKKALILITIKYKSSFSCLEFPVNNFFVTRHSTSWRTNSYSIRIQGINVICADCIT